MMSTQKDLSLLDLFSFSFPLLFILILTGCSTTQNDPKFGLVTDNYGNPPLTSHEELTKIGDYLKPILIINENEIIKHIDLSIDGFEGPKAVIHYQGMLLDNDFDGLQREIENLEHSYKLAPSFENELALLTAYYTFSINYLDYGEIFESWIATYPESHIPYIARGIFRIKLGWAFRGRGYIQNTKKQKLKGMSLFFKAAEKDLFKALSKKPEALAAHLFLVSMSKSGSVGSMHDAFYSGRKYNPKSQFLVDWYANNLDPIWGGTKQQWTLLIKHLEATTPQYIGLVGEIRTVFTARNYRRVKDSDKFGKEVKKLEGNFTLDADLFKTTNRMPVQDQYKVFKRFLIEDFSWGSQLPRITYAFLKRDNFNECIFMSNYALYRKIVSKGILNDAGICYIHVGVNSQITSANLKIAQERFQQSLKLESTATNKIPGQYLLGLRQMIKLQIEYEGELMILDEQ